jgi:hypothetical protein
MGLEINYLDGQTPLTEEEFDGLKILSITSREELDEFEQLNIEKAIQWSFGKKIQPKIYSQRSSLRIYINECMEMFGCGPVLSGIQKRI